MYIQGLIPERLHRLYVSRKGVGGLASIEDCEDVTIQKFKEYTKKSKL